MSADPPPSSLKDLEARLSEARQRAGIDREGKEAKPAGDTPPSSAMGMAMRVGVELTVGVAFGGVMGWYLDKWLGTSPFLLILFFLLGTAAGMLNVMRLGRKINAPDRE